ncbi:MAG: DUF4258 domain-containing protein [Phycisphaerae bacterium]
MRLTFRVHAVQRMFARRIGEADVRVVVEIGRTIRAYPDDTPYPSRLILGFAGGRPLHVVAADVPGSDEVIIITVYEPDPALWNDTFDKRSQQ